MKNVLLTRVYFILFYSYPINEPTLTKKKIC